MFHWYKIYLKHCVKIDANVQVQNGEKKIVPGEVQCLLVLIHQFCTVCVRAGEGVGFPFCKVGRQFFYILLGSTSYCLLVWLCVFAHELIAHELILHKRRDAYCTHLL